jgi:hypothetical protein
MQEGLVPSWAGRQVTATCKGLADLVQGSLMKSVSIELTPGLNLISHFSPFHSVSILFPIQFTSSILLEQLDVSNVRRTLPLTKKQQHSTEKLSNFVMYSLLCWSASI